LRFYELLGFTKTIGPIGPEPVGSSITPREWKSTWY
jgi:hypothetical protein